MLLSNLFNNYDMKKLLDTRFDTDYTNVIGILQKILVVTDILSRLHLQLKPNWYTSYQVYTIPYNRMPCMHKVCGDTSRQEPMNLSAVDRQHQPFYTAL